MTFDQTAASFDNPDFVEVVIHAYRHAFGLALGDPFLGRHEDRAIEAGHNLPQEAPEAFANAVLTVRGWPS